MDKSLLSQLRDIEGLGAISWWPLAPGWWVLLAVSVAVILGINVLRKRPKQEKAPDPQEEAARLLVELRAETSFRKKAEKLSVLLRYLAMRRHGRAACAGLEGKAWLKWLARNDPAQFDWQYSGKALLEAPYAPDGFAGVDLEPMIAAAERWIK